MIRSFVPRLVLAAALSLSLPLAVAAQEATPQDVEWHLVSAGATEVPWYVDITLTLSGGAATGSVVCNRFSGGYTIDGDAFIFDPPLAVTQKGCPVDPGDVADAYLQALPEVAGWFMEEDALVLSDATGEPLLTFEQAVVALTSSDVAALAALLEQQQAADKRLAAAVERLDERVDNMRIGTLRDRIKTLEAQAAVAARSAGPDLSTFTAAEKVLYDAVRKDIARTCEPRRRQNPAGTIAALQCQPDTPDVADMAYYLMESEDASKVYERRMKDHKVKGGTQNRACALGRPSQMWWVGGGLTAAGCYRDTNKRANLRFVSTLAECRQLTAGSTQVKNPTIYIAVLGPGRDISSLYRWAASSNEWEAGEDLFDPIIQPGQPWSDQCPHD